MDAGRRPRPRSLASRAAALLRSPSEWIESSTRYTVGSDATAPTRSGCLRSTADRIDELLDSGPDPSAAAHLHACTHTTLSCNTLLGSMTTITIPGVVETDVDSRTLPGETDEDVQQHLAAALGELAPAVEVEALLDGRASISPTSTAPWDALGKAVERSFPDARLTANLMIGFTDARVYREL